MIGSCLKHPLREAFHKEKSQNCGLFPYPPASTDIYGGLFSKSAYWRLATFGKKSAYVTILGGTYTFH